MSFLNFNHFDIKRKTSDFEAYLTFYNEESSDPFILSRIDRRGW